MSALSPLPLADVAVKVGGRRRRYGVGGEEPAVEVAVAPAVAGQMDMEGARRRRRSRKAGQSMKAGQEGARRRRRSHKAGQEGARRRHKKAGQSMKAGQEGARRRRHSRRH